MKDNFLLNVLVLVVLSLITFQDAANYGYFWHITDLHLDLKYTEGSDPSCVGVVCCRGKKQDKGGAGRFGTLNARCDIPTTTFESALMFMKNFPQKSDFILYGGDNIEHDAVTQTQADSIEYVKLTAGLFAKYFPAHEHLRVYPVIGNHDVHWMDQFSLDDSKNAWFLNPFFESFAPLIFGANSQLSAFPDPKTTLKTKGYYALPIPNTKLTIIAMNSLFHDIYNKNVELPHGNKDFGNQTSWLVSELKKAENENRKVVILGHIPPGFYDGHVEMYRWIKTFSIPYNDEIMPRFQNTILAQFYGHTHKDAYRVFWVPCPNDKSKVCPTSIAYISPGLTTWPKQNPAVRLMKYDRESLQVVDTMIYYLNLTRANQQSDFRELKWELEYSAAQAYFNGKPTIGAQDWFNLYTGMKNYDLEAWKKFDKFNSVLNYLTCPEASKTDYKCARRQICALGNCAKEAFDECNKN